jgi:hypothetical protein
MRHLPMTKFSHNLPASSKSAARRYFKEAPPTAAVTCAQTLALIKQLYVIERAASDRQLDATALQRLRQEQARPSRRLNGALPFIRTRPLAISSIPIY